MGPAADVGELLEVGVAGRGDLVDAPQRSACDRGGAAAALPRPRAVRARALGLLPRRLPAVARTRARYRGHAGCNQARADGALRRLGHRPRRVARGRRVIPRGSHEYRGAISQPIHRLEELGKHRRARHLRPGPRCPDHVRRADGGAPRSRANGDALCVGIPDAWRARGARRRHGRALREHRVVATRLPEQPGAVGARLLDPRAVAAARRRAERVSARLPRELPDDAIACWPTSKKPAGSGSLRSTSGRAASASRPPRVWRSSTHSAAASSTNTGRRNA